MTGFQRVPLGQVAEQVERPIAPVPGNAYRQLGVRLWGQGAYERESVDGQGTKYAQLFRAESGDIVVNKIWARNGSVAVVDDRIAGCYGSGEFPMFAPDRTQLDSRWMHWLTKSPSFWAQCDLLSRGTSGQNRIRPEQFLRVEIPLPSLAEQRRIVDRIEFYDAKVAEAQGLRQAGHAELQALQRARSRDVFQSLRAQPVNLADVCIAIIDNLHTNPTYSETGMVPCIRSPDVGFGWLDLESARKTDDNEYQRRTVRGEPQSDDIVLVREGGGTGKCALVLAGQRFSLGQRVMMLRPNGERIMPRYLLHHLLSPVIQQDQIQVLSKGSASPHLNIGALRKFPIVLPSLDVQAEIVGELDSLAAKVDGVSRLQHETAAELDAMLPAILDKAYRGQL